jgi:hydroxymethylglutaryl-CoA lyase
MQAYPETIVIEEQGLRDGIQSESAFVPTDKKLRLIHALVDAGVKRLQVTSFVNPRLVPQLADAEQVCAGLRRAEGVVYSALTLNVRGMRRAAEAGLRHVEASLSASDTHSRRNANRSRREARQACAEMARIGRAHGMTLRGGLQCAFGCRFEGRINPDTVFDMAKELLDLEVDEIALADSTGMADPRSVAEICSKVIELAGGRTVILHLHDTEGRGLANALAGMLAGIRHFDTTFGGMGGCPFIQGASGNIATEDLVSMLTRMGIRTGIDVEKVAAVSRSVEDFLGRRFSGKMHRLLDRSDIQILRS